MRLKKVFCTTKQPTSNPYNLYQLKDFPTKLPIYVVYLTRLARQTTAGLGEFFD